MPGVTIDTSLHREMNEYIIVSCTAYSSKWSWHGTQHLTELYWPDEKDTKCGTIPSFRIEGQYNKQIYETCNIS